LGYRRAARPGKTHPPSAGSACTIFATFATLQLSAGVHFMQASKWLVHSTFTLTLDVYGDYIPEQEGGALNNLPEPPARVGQADLPSNVVKLFG